MICSEFAPKLSNSKPLKLFSFAEQFEKNKIRASARGKVSGEKIDPSYHIAIFMPTSTDCNSILQFRQILSGSGSSYLARKNGMDRLDEIGR